MSNLLGSVAMLAFGAVFASAVWWQTKPEFDDRWDLAAGVPGRIIRPFLRTVAALVGCGSLGFAFLNSVGS